MNNISKYIRRTIRISIFLIISPLWLGISLVTIPTWILMWCFYHKEDLFDEYGAWVDIKSVWQLPLKIWKDR